MMFMLGVALYGTTVLLPQFVQTLHGLHGAGSGAGADARRLHGDAVHAGGGLSCSAGGRTRATWCRTGMFVLSLSLFYMTRFNLQIDFYTATMARVYQAAALAFLFVPINTLVYAIAAAGEE